MGVWMGEEKPQREQEKCHNQYWSESGHRPFPCYGIKKAGKTGFNNKNFGWDGSEEELSLADDSDASPSYLMVLWLLWAVTASEAEPSSCYTTSTKCPKHTHPFSLGLKLFPCDFSLSFAPAVNQHHLPTEFLEANSSFLERARAGLSP